MSKNFQSILKNTWKNYEFTFKSWFRWKKRKIIIQKNYIYNYNVKKLDKKKLKPYINMDKKIIKFDDTEI